MQQQVQLTTASQIMREMAYGWLHTIDQGRGCWVTKARLTRGGHLFLTLQPPRPGTPSREVAWSPAMPLWTLI